MLLENNYFMVTFNCMEDRNRVFEGGSYFHNQVGCSSNLGMWDLTLQRSFQIVSWCGFNYLDFHLNVVERMCCEC